MAIIFNPESDEAPGKISYSVIPAKAGIQNRLKTWIPGRASLARNDDLFSLPRVLQEPPMASKYVYFQGAFDETI
jgi:hypothetical protein